jgi:CheY-like chemotaxis protein
MKVLMIEQHPLVLRGRSEELRRSGFEVVPTNNYEEAWQLALQHAPHVVLARVRRDARDEAFAFCDHVRREPSLSDTLLIALINYSGWIRVGEATSAGFHHELSFHISAEELVRQLNLQPGRIPLVP